MVIIIIIALVTEWRDSIQCKIGPKRVACNNTQKYAEIPKQKHAGGFKKGASNHKPMMFNRKEKLKGVILAGGLGTRLHPLTKVTSKHLLPVGNEPMVFHSVKQLTAAGITDILIVTNPQYVGDFVRVLGGGNDFGCEFTYRVQEEAKGITHALALAEGFASGGRIAVLLGDNIFETSIQPAVNDFQAQQQGARVLLKQVSDPERYGVATLNGRHIVAIEEKPKHPKSDYAVVGAYFYEASVFDIIPTVEPSARGEYEITAVNNAYIQRGELEYSLLEGKWTDAGTFESLTEAHQILLNSSAW